MKSGTVARIVDYGLMIAILLALIVPAVVSVSENGVSNLGLGIPSVYDMDELDEMSLSDNIQAATNGEYGYSVSYGDNNIEIDQSRLDEICAEIMKTDCETVTVLDPMGEIAKQDAIVYTNSVYTKQEMGFMAPGFDSVPILMNMGIGLKDPQGNMVFKGNSEYRSDESGMFLTFYIPMIPYLAASAAGYSSTVTSSADLTGIFQMNMDIDMPQLDEVAFKFTTVAGITTLTFDTSYAGNTVGTIGDIVVTSSTATGLSMTYSGDLSDRMNDLADKGPVDITMDGKVYTMSQEDAHGLAEIFEDLEATQ